MQSVKRGKNNMKYIIFGLIFALIIVTSVGLVSATDVDNGFNGSSFEDDHFDGKSIAIRWDNTTELDDTFTNHDAFNNYVFEEA